MIKIPFESPRDGLHIVIILILLFVHYPANAIDNTLRQNHRVTLSANNIPLEEIFRSIRKQTGLTVTYNSRETRINDREKVNIHFTNADLNEVMSYLLKNKNLTYIFGDEAIIILKDDFSKKNPDSERNIHDTASVGFTLLGKVTDLNGNAIPGATVKIDGSRLGTVTDTDGKFLLPKVNKNQNIVISSVGFNTQKLLVKDNYLHIQLEGIVSTLDETVVIAYGTTTKRMNVGNISTVKAADIEKQPVGNVLESLQGRVTGVYIEQDNGLPGGGIKVRVQGQNSINNGNDPLYVIDGVPFPSQMLPGINDALLSPGRADAGVSPLTYMNASDIESIDILKDADATAIYGSRAANGAILITTKKGKAGKTQVSFNFQTGWAEVPRRMKVLNTQQYLQMRREGMKNDNITSLSLTDYDLNGTWDTLRNTNWQKELIGRSANYINAQLSISGGNLNTQYLISGSYQKETTVFPGNFSDTKASVHFNINSISPNQRFRILLSGNFLYDINLLPQFDLTIFALGLPPVAPSLYDRDGALNWQLDSNGVTTFYNPLSKALNKYKGKTNNLLSNALLSYQVIPGLDAKVNVGYNNIQSNEIVTFPLIANPPETQAFTPRSAGYNSTNINSWTIEPQIEYVKDIAKGKLNTLIGTTIQQTNSNGQQLVGSGYISDGVMEDIKSATNMAAVNTINATYKYNAIFGRINYVHNGKFILDMTARRDGSSRFGSENQFNNFYGIAGGWIFTQEKFFKKRTPFISFGKLKASYGTIGSDQIRDYRFLSLYNPIMSDLGYQGIKGLQSNGLTNPFLKWEETKKLQVGLDIGFLQDRILLNTNYTRNRSSNQLLEIGLPLLTGFQFVPNNLPAIVQNTSWEFNLNTINIKKKDFTWSTNLNLTIPENKLVSFPELATSAFASLLIVGQSINVVQLYKFIGVNESTGNYQFMDSKGNLTTDPNPVTDRIRIVNTTPQFYGGFHNSFTYKGVQLDVSFQFVKQIAKQDIQLGLSSPPGTFQNILGNQPIWVLDRWQKSGDKAPIEQYHYSDALSFPLWFNTINNSDALWVDASFLKLRNVSISWQLPDQWKKKIRLQGCRLFIHGQNLLTITPFKGLDPEIKSSTYLPPLRKITIGAQIVL